VGKKLKEKNLLFQRQRHLNLPSPQNTAFWVANEFLSLEKRGSLIETLNRLGEIMTTITIKAMYLEWVSFAKEQNEKVQKHFQRLSLGFVVFWWFRACFSGSIVTIPHE